MKSARIKIKLKSSVITPFMADTIFGHLAWAVKYLYGEDFLKDFLTQYNELPPFVTSNGFPEGFLPRPCTDMLSADEEEKLLESYYKTPKINGLIALKNLKKFSLIHSETFYKLIGDYSEYNLYELVYTDKYCPDNFRTRPEECKNPLQECRILNPKIVKPCPYVMTENKAGIVSRNTINRISNTVLAGGGFYQQNETFYRPGAKFDIYVKYQEEYHQEIKDAFEFVAKSGYGKDKSTGKGNFEIIDFTEFSFPECAHPYAYMSLSNYVPSQNDPVDGKYKLITKFGKLGGDYAKSAIEDDSVLLPFKKPLIMFEAGSFFKVKDGPKDYYGRMINDIHKNGKIVHYGLSYPLYFARGGNGKI